MPRFLRSWALALAFGLASGPTLCLCQVAENGKKAIRLDRVIAGGPNDFMEVRHLVLRGTNLQIGRALATVAKERYSVRPEASVDRARTRAQRRYFERNYPILHDRLRGVAAAFGKRLDDDGWI